MLHRLTSTDPDHAPVVRVEGDDPEVVYVVEPVTVPASGPGSAELRLEDLIDVEGTDQAAALVPLVLRRGSDGVFRAEPLDLTAVQPRPGSYEHRQLAAAQLWQVQHNLGFLPTFTAYDTSGAPIAHDGITHPVPGVISEVMFGADFAGSGYAS